MTERSGRDPLTGLMLLAACVTLGFGLMLPALTVERFWIFDSTKSIASAILTLFDGGHVLLGAVVVLFSVVFPLAKLVVNLRIWLARDIASPGIRRAARWAVTLGKWSMLDVFMAAIVVATVTLGMVASVTTEIGLYLFGGAIVLSMLAAQRQEARLAAALERGGTPPA